MTTPEKLAEVDRLAAKYQPPVRNTNASDYVVHGDEEQDTKGIPMKDGVVLVCGSDLTPTPFTWVWKYWLAQGKLHIFAGAAGEGKTTIALAFSATITSGGCWPDGSLCTTGNVLIWSGEDDPADTLLPRLIAMGADRNRVYFVDSVNIRGEVTTFDPARDMVQLQKAIDYLTQELAPAQ